MKKLYPLLCGLFLIHWGCEEEQPEEIDTTPPTVSISSHSSGQSVFEIVTIIVTTQDNDGISKVDFFINDSLVLSDTSSPYQYDWNTVPYEEDSEHIIKAISYDNSNNSTESQPIMLKIDNSTSTPNGGDIISVTYTFTEMTVEWEESTVGDFKEYKLLYSTTETGIKDTIDTFADNSITSYTTNDFNPLIQNWYWIQVTDTLGLSRIGDGMTNSIDLEPNPVDISSVLYNLDSMTITWEEYILDSNRTNRINLNTNSSVANDFISYELLRSDSENGTYNSVIVITDQSKLYHSIRDFNPTIENWFKIKVTDYWGLTSIGNGMPNQIDNPPEIPILFQPVVNDSSISVSWVESEENDFYSYKLYESINNDMGGEILIYESYNINDNSFSFIIPQINNSEYLFFKLVVTDAWGLESYSNLQIADLRIMFDVSFNSGGSNEDRGRSVRQTSDGGYIITGQTSQSLSLLKFDYQGQLEWHRNYSNAHMGYCVQQTFDGGYIIFGTTYSNSDFNVFLLKTDSNGYQEWDQSFGVEGIYDVGYYGQQTNDGGYIITGVFGNQSLLIKTDSQGEKEWENTLNTNQTGFCVQQTLDGGYVISGEDTNEFNSIFLTKVDLQGQLEWSQDYGDETGSSGGSSVQQTPDGGFIIRGYTNLFSSGSNDVWLIKTDSEGVEVWNQTFGGISNDLGLSMDQTLDGGYVITGYTESYGSGQSDVWLIKTDSEGMEEWNQTYGGSSADKGYSVQNTNDGGFIITGYKISSESSSRDIWLIKTDSQGNIF